MARKNPFTTISSAEPNPLVMHASVLPAGHTFYTWDLLFVRPPHTSFDCTETAAVSV